MRELGNLVIAHGRRHALQSVGIAEYLIDYVLVLAVFLDIQEPVIQRLQMLMRFIKEHSHVLISIHLYSPYYYLFTASTMARAINSTGLTSSARPASTTAFGMP